MTLKQNETRGSGRRSKSPKLRVRPGQQQPRKPLSTDPATAQIVNRLRNALKGPIWFYAKQQEGDE